MVVRSGGVEGKFVQDVYPYLYLVRDTGLAAAAGADGDPDGEGAGGGLIEAAPGERTVARTLRALSFAVSGAGYARANGVYLGAEVRSRGDQRISRVVHDHPCACA